MKSLTLIVSISSALLFAGCASNPSANGGSSSSGTTTAPGSAATAPAVAAPVAIPAAAQRRVVLTMTGPKSVTESKDWNEFKREWRETFGEHAKQAGLAYSFAEAEPKFGGAEDGTLLTVNVADYRLVGIGARIMLGVMTGNAYIEAKVKFANLRDGKAFGEQAYSTTSSAWGGIFAKVTPQQVDAIASNVFQSLKPGR